MPRQQPANPLALDTACLMFGLAGFVAGVTDVATATLWGCGWFLLLTPPAGRSHPRTIHA